MHKLEVLTQILTRCTRPRTSPQSRNISTRSDLGQPPYELVGQARKSRIIYGIDSLRDLKPFAYIFRTLRRV